ncbi:hypothetical protein BDR04DRAFT_1123294 [Suillus decipiens]|nr:hypothetical protein BDR04DRAFT_1123294 [Suillus decipiens]
MPSAHKCPGCGRPFDDSPSPSAHKRFCKRVIKAASNTLKKRRHNIEAQEAAKVQRREEEDAQRRREEIRDNAGDCAEDSTIRTDPNHYGIYRTYHGNLPTHSPDDLVSPASISDSSTFGRRREQTGARPSWSGFGSSVQTLQDNFFAPFLNVTTFLLMCWFHSGSNMKSLAELDRLVNEVILVKEFDKADLQGFRASKEVERLDNYHGDPDNIRSSFSSGDGWQETSVKIRVPADGSLEDAPEFSVPEHNRMRSQPRENGCTLETVVAAIMLWSDSTHVASFGTASLWPIYLFLGNQSEYVRGKTFAFAAHHIAYIPKLSDTIQDFRYSTHCRHEFMQAIWLLLMDDDFMHAFEFGIVIECLDGIRRRIFPRFFTYSADYPEKTLLACIKFLAQCPCPRGLTSKSKIGDFWRKADRRRREHCIREDSHWLWSTISMVRGWLYRKGVNITSKRVKDNLGPRLLIPILSAFSTRSKRFGFNFYELFVPDLLHEFELGVMESNFHSPDSHFVCTCADFEDLLQCAIPVFEGLLPSPYNELLLDLSFELATWHGLAKLRMHTDTTLNFLDLSQELHEGDGKGLHALGDYVQAIRKFGTSDNYLTQPQGECEHRRVKRFYPRVSKAKFTAGIAKQQRRECILLKMAEGSPYENRGKGKKNAGKQKRWLSQHGSDPALNTIYSPDELSNAEHNIQHCYHFKRSSAVAASMSVRQIKRKCSARGGVCPAPPHLLTHPPAPSVAPPHISIISPSSPFAPSIAPSRISTPPSHTPLTPPFLLQSCCTSMPSSRNPLAVLFYPLAPVTTVSGENQDIQFA